MKSFISNSKRIIPFSIDLNKYLLNCLKINLKEEEVSVGRILKTDKLIKENFNNILKNKEIGDFS